MVMTGSEEGLSPAWAKGHILPILRVRETPTTHAQRDPSGSEREGVPGCNKSGNLPAMHCFGIHLGQKMLMQMAAGPGSGQM